MANECENEIKCPYCNYEFSDSHEYDDENHVLQKVDCQSCEKEFELQVAIIVSYSTYKKPCTDDKHDMQEDWVIDGATNMLCKDCDYEEFIPKY